MACTLGPVSTRGLHLAEVLPYLPRPLRAQHPMGTASEADEAPFVENKLVWTGSKQMIVSIIYTIWYQTFLTDHSRMTVLGKKLYVFMPLWETTFSNMQSSVHIYSSVANMTCLYSKPLRATLFDFEASLHVLWKQEKCQKKGNGGIKC